MTIKTIFTCIAAAAMFASTSVQADLLTNGGFETGDLTGWTTVTPTATVGAPGVGAQSGSFAAQLNALMDSVPEINQSFAAAAGDEFYFSGYMLTETALPAGATFGLLKMVFRDGAGFTGNDLQVTSASLGTIVGPANPGVESIQLNSSSTPNTWIFGEIQAFAPVGTQSVGFLVLDVDFGNGANHPMYFDSFTASKVPEPGSLALLGVGALGLIARRRRS